MGNSIAASIAEQQKKVQKEMQQEMGKMQLENMIKGQERQRKMMMAQQIAITRERLYWFVGFGTFATTGAIVGAMRGHSSSTAVIPLIAFWTITGYQYDLAFGTKANRINKYYEEIVNDKSYWIYPIDKF